jgi:hypothetical protein
MFVDRVLGGTLIAVFVLLVGGEIFVLAIAG